MKNKNLLYVYEERIPKILQNLIISEIKKNKFNFKKMTYKTPVKIQKKLFAWSDAVKFQKRTVDLVYSKEQLAKPRVSPFGSTEKEQKEGLEFDEKDYDEIDKYCKEKNIIWFASAWDLDSLKFLDKYNLKYHKVASAMIVDEIFLNEVAKRKKHTFISTGMSDFGIIDKAVNIFKKMIALLSLCIVYQLTLLKMRLQI